MQEFLMKSKSWDGSRIDKDGYWISEKMDGHRVFWDGGVTIGQRVGWSKDVSTGWWSNGAKAIKCPTSWTEWMIKEGVGPLEGELWGGRNTFQAVSSIVRSTVTIKDWGKSDTLPNGVRLFITGPVSWDNFLTVRSIKVRNEVVGSITWDDRFFWLNRNPTLPLHTFKEWYESWLERVLPSWLVLTPNYWTNDLCFISKILGDIIGDGGEGIMLRSDRLVWIPKRCNIIMKYKAVQDGEAVIVGHVLGEGRLEGMIGALVVDWTDINGKVVRFEIGTGMDDSFRSCDPVGKECRFKFRELTDKGIPKEARFVCLI